ncbi:MAG: flap endonuclease-1 [Methanobacteriota archaeon]|nr:MAG: flap endonuclease-1 [Euryarchaeota archaeon]
MGVQLSGLFEPKVVEFKELAGKRIAIDAYNALYQFLSIIRQPTGEPLMDRDGNVTSHLSGLLYRNANLLEYGVLPVYVFDGAPPELKKGVVEGRVDTRLKAEERWKEALARGDLEEARIQAQASARLSRGILEDAKRLLGYMGIPVVQAPSEGEAQAAYMAGEKAVWAVGSQDFDSLLFGAPRLVRNITITGKRKLPRKNIYVNIVPELFDSETVLSDLGITREQLIDLSILVGTDYNPGGVEGIGPKKAYKIIRETGGIDVAVEKGLVRGFDYEPIKAFFMNPPVTDDYELSWKAPDEEGVVDFLCGERDFTESRVRKALEKIRAGIEKGRSQFSLDGWL